MKAGRRLVVVSNRLPITAVENAQQFQRSGGGLINALVPLLDDSWGCWVGWTGTHDEPKMAKVLNEWSATKQCPFGPVFLTAAERASFYRGFSNEIIWPLFHGLPSRCQFETTYWEGYRKANKKFADVVVKVSRPDDFVWVHDYHLMMVAQELRSRGMGNSIAYFHHIPFPSPDIFETLPWRNEVLQALMCFNSLGFQTVHDRRNFIACLRRCMPHIRVGHAGKTLQVRAGGQCAHAGAYPISVDFEGFARDAAGTTISSGSKAIENQFPDMQIILGIDRLDYTKGIPERLIAFEKLLISRPGLHGRVNMVQIVVPSREEIPEYNQLRLRIETLIGKINGQYSKPGWVPIHYFYRSISRNELIAFYRAAQVALVTPLKDGMNLVAKEFCASRIDNRGVLVLSEFAGAAEELKCGAMLVNPHDTETVAGVLDVALSMDESEQSSRMKSMRLQIRDHDVFNWYRAFRTATEGSVLTMEESPIRPLSSPVPEVSRVPLRRAFAEFQFPAPGRGVEGR
ncbi:MAG TPA: trehalose-6-phosphate synthase [Terriglobia bacterium]|nr:trehalose-6-phosphate synthase [Terriglobia bacterium]